MQETATWIFVVDAGHGRLFRGEAMPQGRYRLEADGEIDETWQEHEHGRPSRRTGKSANSYASRGHEQEERLNRFVRQAVEWVEQRTKTLAIDRLSLFAPPRFLGAWRQACPAGLAARISEHEADLGYMTPGELARHAAVVKVLKANGSRK